MKIIFFLLLILFLFTDAGRGASSDDETKLKQFCENNAQELFGRETRRMKLEHYKLNYKSHYHQNLKTCFMMIQLSTDLNQVELPPFENLSFDFYDVDQNEKIGSFFMQLDRKNGKNTLFFCHFSEVECHSLPEWQKLIKPYSEE